MQFTIKNLVNQRLSDIFFLPNGLVRKKVTSLKSCNRPDLVKYKENLFKSNCFPPVSRQITG